MPQSVADWLKNKNTGISVIPPQLGAIQSVAQWKATRPAITVSPQAPIETPQPKEDTSFLGEIKDMFASTIQGVKNITSDIFNIKPTLDAGGWQNFSKQFFDSTIGAVKDAVLQDKQRIQDYWSTVKSNVPISEKVSKGLGVVSGQLGVALSPISAIFGAAEQIPILGTIAKAITLPFNVTGDLGGRTATTALNLLPIPTEDKVKLYDAVHEIGALAGQILLGGKVAEYLTPAKVVEFTKKYGEDGLKTITEKAQEKANATIKLKESVAPEVPKITETPKAPLSVAEWKAQGKPEAPIVAPNAPQEAITPKVENIAQVPQFYPGSLKIEKAKNLAPEKQIIEAKFADEVQNNTNQLIGEYRKNFGKTLNTDNARELSPDYAPGGVNALDQITKDTRSQNSPAVHEPASALIKEIYQRDLVEKKGQGNNTVLFTAGPTGVGKSTSINDVLSIRRIKEDAPIVYDTNFASKDSSIKKIDAAIKAGFDVVVAYVHRGPIESMINTLNRAKNFGRTVPLEDQLNTHIGSPKTILELIEYYKNNEKVSFHFIDNTGGKGSAKLSSIDIVKKLRYDEVGLRNQLKQTLQNEYNNRTISKTIYEGTSGTLGERQGGFIGTRNGGNIEPQRIEGRPRTPGEEPKLTPLQSRVFERLKAENPSLEGDLGYDPIKLKEDAQKAVDLIATDKQKAFRVAMGAEVSPDITSTAVNIAMAEKALADGNTSLYTRLIKNRSLEQTRRGQEIVAERGSVTDNSTSKYVKELVASRLEALGKRYFGDLKNLIKKTTDKERGIGVIDREVTKVEAQIKGKKLDVKTALGLLDKLACV